MVCLYYELCLFCVRVKVSPVDGRSQLPTPTPERFPPVVHFTMQPNHTTTSTTGTGSDSSDSEYSSNSVASGISHELKHYDLQASRGRATRSDFDDVRINAGLKSSAGHTEPHVLPSYSVREAGEHSHSHLFFKGRNVE